MPFQHFWSFDAEGKSRISNRKRRYLGLPTRRLTYKHRVNHTVSWPTSTYKGIHQWQLSRGFDPNTTDFARFLGYPAFEIMSQRKSSQFEELAKNKGF
ncbi:hypothetical protein L218DRAFT_881672 [Marasmius fiardii PR-910]|nr:hypothetical protein L218DRAFT_881672 [Marasmius fiardii PR-910]